MKDFLLGDAGSGKTLVIDAFFELVSVFKFVFPGSGTILFPPIQNDLELLLFVKAFGCIEGVKDGDLLIFDRLNSSELLDRLSCFIGFFKLTKLPVG